MSAPGTTNPVDGSALPAVDATSPDAVAGLSTPPGRPSPPGVP